MILRISQINHKEINTRFILYTNQFYCKFNAFDVDNILGKLLLQNAIMIKIDKCNRYIPTNNQRHNVHQKNNWNQCQNDATIFQEWNT